MFNTMGKLARRRLGQRGANISTIAIVLFPMFIAALITWAQGAVATGRTTNIALLLCIMTSPLVFQVTKIYIPQRLSIKSVRLRYGLAVVDVLGFLSVNVPAYVGDIFIGRTKQAHALSQLHFDRLSAGTPSTDITLPPYVNPPKRLHFNFMSVDPSNWVNMCIAKAWQVKPVRLAKDTHNSKPN